MRRAGIDGERAGERMDRGFGRARRGIESISRQLRGLQNLGAIWASFAGIRSVATDFIRTADAMTSLNARLRLVTASQQAFAQAQRDVQAISASTRGDLQSVAGLYTRLTQVSDSLGLSQQQVAAVTESVAAAVTLSGGSAQEAAAGVQQLAQALASGRLAGDEFRSVMENSPRVVQALTDSLDVSVGQLRELAEQQLLTADIVVEALTLQHDRLVAQVASMPQTVGQALQQVNNAWALLVNSFNEGSATTTVLGEALGGVADQLRDSADAARNGAPSMEFLGTGVKIAALAVIGPKNVVEALTNVFAANITISLEFAKAVIQGFPRASGDDPTKGYRVCYTDAVAQAG